MVALAVLAAAPVFAFGREGGSVRPAQVTIAANGVVRSDGRPTGRRVGAARLASLEALARRERFGGLPARTLCTGTNPDVATRYVAFKGRTVRVHGACSVRFDALYVALARAAGTR